jgi:lactate permease
VTGSATASNVLFTSLQDQAASSLGLPLAVILAAQTVGAAVGNAICPHNIIAGAAAVGAAGREGEIMRRTLPACALILLAAGLLALAAARFQGS